MKSAPSHSGAEARRRPLRRAFTLIEVLAALLLMAIIIPVAMQGMGVATRAGVLGQRKAAAMRVAERVLNELIVTNEVLSSGQSGNIAEGGTTYAWTLESQNWTEGAMLLLTVRVNFDVQGNTYDIAASTLVDPLAPVVPAAEPVE
jgi:type II secretion system protein I